MPNNNYRVSCEFEGCNKTFQSKFKLRNHINTHTGDRPHKCELCLMGFYSDTNLKSHVAAVHNKTTRVFCNKCEKTYASKTNKNRHVCIKDEDLICKQCNIKYNQRRFLDAHLSKDHVEKNEKFCQICSVKFKTLFTFQKHIIKEHDSNKYRCFECELNFKTFLLFKIHNKTKHKYIIKSNDKPVTKTEKESKINLNEIKSGEIKNNLIKSDDKISLYDEILNNYEDIKIDIFNKVLKNECIYGTFDETLLFQEKSDKRFNELTNNLDSHK